MWRTRIIERCGEVLRRLADQIRLAHVPEQVADRLQPALLGHTTRDPEDVGIAAQRLAHGVGVCRLAVVDEPGLAQGPDRFHAVGEAGKGQDGIADFARWQAERAHGGVGGGGVLRIVRAFQGLGIRQVADRDAALARAVHQLAAQREHAVAESPLGRDRHDAAAIADLELGRQRAAIIVVHADHHRVRACLVGEHDLLGAAIVVHRAVAVEMIGRQVEQHGGVGAKALRALQLIARQLDDVVAARMHAVEVEHAAPDIAADLRVLAERLQDVSDERRGRGLAIGPGDGDDLGAV